MFWEWKAFCRLAMSCLIAGVIQGLSFQWKDTFFCGKILSIASFKSFVKESARLSDGKFWQIFKAVLKISFKWRIYVF